jgi:hypothetical protein
MEPVPRERRMHAPRRPRTLPRAALALLGPALLLGGCVLATSPSAPGFGNPVLVQQVIRILDVDEPSPAFYRERARLEAMGAELDPILFALAGDASIDESVRANALVLLADRRPPGAMRFTRRELVVSPSDAVRSAAVQALQRFARDSIAARNAIRAAVGDPSPMVRLNVLQRLDVEDAPLVRAQLRREPDAQVRTIARQLLELLEARGAPLARDDRGDLRASVREGAPQLVFHPTWADRVAEVESGALWVELPGSLVPLAQDVEVVGAVVPAFFDPARAMVVFETGREIRIRDLRTGETRVVGAGIAPRPIPFTPFFVFAREVPEGRVLDPEGNVIAMYHLFRAGFDGDLPIRVGGVEARIRSVRWGGASPVRTMVVGEAIDGFVLRAAGMSPVPLPGPVLNPATVPR